jgi:hypothetical protein
MSHTLTIPDDLYHRLDAEARAQGLTIEQLLRAWAGPTRRNEEEKPRTSVRGVRHVSPSVDFSPPVHHPTSDPAVLARVAILGDELTARYGEMPDSADLIREDRAR